MYIDLKPEAKNKYYQVKEEFDKKVKGIDESIWKVNKNNKNNGNNEKIFYPLRGEALKTLA